MSLRPKPRGRRLAALAVVAAAGALVCTGVLWLTAHGRGRGGQPASGASPLPANATRLRQHILHREAVDLLRAGQYSSAASKWEAAWREASREDDQENAARFLNNLGACYVAAFRYREGLAAYLKAKEIALRRGDWESAAGLEASLSVLYLEMGEVNSALEAAESGLAWLRDRPAPGYRPRLLLQLGKLRARTGQLDAAVHLFSEALREADRNADSATQALAWNHLGYELLRAGRLEAAERALLEAFRIRKFTKDKALLTSYRLLGLLRMAQGDLGSASRLLDEAVALVATSPRLIPLWQLYHDRGRVRMAQGRLEEALGDFRRALDSARRWRPEVLPADPLRVSSETGLQEVYASLVEAGNRLYFLRGEPTLARETFEAAEENRAYSLRMLVAEPQEWRDKLPPEYGETLLRLRQVEGAVLAGGSPPSGREIGRLHRRLIEMEAHSGMDLPVAAEFTGGTGGLVERLQRCLTAGEALLSFHLGEPDSYLWGVTAEGFELRKLPPRSHLRERVARFVQAVRQGTREAGGLAATLYQELLGGLRAFTRQKPHWFLTLDDALFELPFAALAESSGPGGLRYLIESHSLEVVPGAHLLVSARSPRRDRARPGGVFLGIGDPVYNAADPRWSAPAGAAPVKGRRLELPRLAGSAREIRACARLWSTAGFSQVLLEGAAATGEQIAKNLERQPAAAHFATHVVPSSRKRGLIALSLGPGGEAELLSPLEIVQWRRSPSLVVLSGCSSGQGEALPGAGLIGLTRAWVAAGAETVVATRWPTADDTGELLLAFYRRVLGTGTDRGGVPPATALREAQRESLHSGSWRSAPSYWAAFLAVGIQ